MTAIDEGINALLIGQGQLSAQMNAVMLSQKQALELLNRLTSGAGDVPPVPPGPQPVPPVHPRATQEGTGWLGVPMAAFDADGTLDRALFGIAPDGRRINSGDKLAAAHAEWLRLSGLSYAQWLSDANGSAYAAAKLSNDAVFFLVHLDLVDFTDPWRAFGGRGQKDAASWAGLGLEQAVGQYLASLTPGTPGGGQE